MSDLPPDVEFTSDWDWFAVDQEGSLGHFATACNRSLPASVRQDIETLEELATYFENAPETDGFTVRTEFEQSHKFKSNADRTRQLAYFLGMASRGLYSYDADETTPD